MENEKKDSALVRSSAAEYLTFVASTGEDKDSIEMRYEDENIWLTPSMSISKRFMLTMSRTRRQLFGNSE